MTMNNLVWNRAHIKNSVNEFCLIIDNSFYDVYLAADFTAGVLMLLYPLECEFLTKQ